MMIYFLIFCAAIMIERRLELSVEIEKMLIILVNKIRKKKKKKN